MAERRADRIAQLLEESSGRAQIRGVLDALRRLEGNGEIPAQAVYVAIQAENQRLEELGERPRFRTSRHGEQRGWVSLQPLSKFPPRSAAHRLEQEILTANRKVDDEIRKTLENMAWRTFESTFLTAVLEKLGFQDVVITQATRDGGTDARVTYKRGIVEANAIVSAKRWSARSVGVEEVRLMRGVQGNEDTAIIVTSGKFSSDAQDEARPSQNQRVVYLIDGERLVQICKQYGIGVEKIPLPEILIVNPDRFQAVDEEDDDLVDDSEVPDERERRLYFRESWLGDSDRGLSAREVAELLGLSHNTVRSYLCDPHRRRALADRIRSDDEARTTARRIVMAKATPRRPSQRSSADQDAARLGVQRLHESMLGDCESGLSASELSDLLGLQESTVRNYLCDASRRSDLASRLREDTDLREKALHLIARKRANQ